VQRAFETSSLHAFLEPLLALDLTIQQLRVLAILVAEGGATTGQSLSKMLGVSLATVSGIVDRLETHNMLERVLDQDDQRVRRLIATTRGRTTIQRLLAAQSQFRTAPVEHLDIEDLRALVRGLQAVVRANTPPPTSPRP